MVERGIHRCVQLYIQATLAQHGCHALRYSRRLLLKGPPVLGQGDDGLATVLPTLLARHDLHGLHALDERREILKSFATETPRLSGGQFRSAFLRIAYDIF